MRKWMGPCTNMSHQVLTNGTYGNVIWNNCKATSEKMWWRVCLPNMIQEFREIIKPDHCADGGLRWLKGKDGRHWCGVYLRCRIYRFTKFTQAGGAAKFTNLPIYQIYHCPESVLSLASCLTQWPLRESRPLHESNDSAIVVLCTSLFHLCHLVSMSALFQQLGTLVQPWATPKNELGDPWCSTSPPHPFQHHGVRSPGSMSQDLSHNEQPSWGSGALWMLSSI